MFDFTTGQALLTLALLLGVALPVVVYCLRKCCCPHVCEERVVRSEAVLVVGGAHDRHISMQSTTYTTTTWSPSPPYTIDAAGAPRRPSMHVLPYLGPGLAPPENQLPSYDEFMRSQDQYRIISEMKATGAAAP